MFSKLFLNPCSDFNYANLSVCFFSFMQCHTEDIIKDNSWRSQPFIIPFQPSLSFTDISPDSVSQSFNIIMYPRWRNTQCFCNVTSRNIVIIVHVCPRSFSQCYETLLIYFWKTQLLWDVPNSFFFLVLHKCFSK